MAHLAGSGDLQRLATAQLREHWVLYLVEGIVLIAVGAAAIFFPPAATLAATIFLGWLLLISGAVGLATTLYMRGPGFWWSLLSAIIGVAAGAVVIASPLQGAVSLTVILGIFFIVEGVVSILFAIDHRAGLPGAWAWMLASGIVDLALAAIIFAGLPGSAAWAIGLLVGINLVFGGVALVAMSLKARNLTPTARG
jgi:uncharacterized membrane protein HdeD (DUF308 family)